VGQKVDHFYNFVTPVYDDMPSELKKYPIAINLQLQLSQLSVKTIFR